MHLQRLILTQYKNYDRQLIECSLAFNCVVGKNGMGKTNLLDAIYYLCIGKSYFTPLDRYVVQHEQTFFRLEGYFKRNNKTEKIVAKVQPGKTKALERGDVVYAKLAEHVGLLPVVVIAPDDTSLVSEGSESRRRFLDNTLSQLDPVYLKHLIQYNKLLKQRNALLKEFAKKGQVNLALIQTYDDQMAGPAQAVYEKRRQLIQALTPKLEKYYQRISGAQESVSCAYQSSLAEAPLAYLLGKSWEKDRALQRTTVGIHRDELLFQMEGSLIKRFGSQGQRKSFLFALKLAQYEILAEQSGNSPILLLDDLFDKLDQDRVEQLLSLLREEPFGQIFISDTDMARMQQVMKRLAVNYRIFKVEAGQVDTLAEDHSTNE
ncbi:MAG: DNA replication and repair protein RecF [Bacteroidota bacterium]